MKHAGKKWRRVDTFFVVWLALVFAALGMPIFVVWIIEIVAVAVVIIVLGILRGLFDHIDHRYRYRRCRKCPSSLGCLTVLLESPMFFVHAHIALTVFSWLPLSLDSLETSSVELLSAMLASHAACFVPLPKILEAKRAIRIRSVPAIVEDHVSGAAVTKHGFSFEGQEGGLPAIRFGALENVAQNIYCQAVLASDFFLSVMRKPT